MLLCESCGVYCSADTSVTVFFLTLPCGVGGLSNSEVGRACNQSGGTYAKENPANSSQQDKGGKPHEKMERFSDRGRRRVAWHLEKLKPKVENSRDNTQRRPRFDVGCNAVTAAERGASSFRVAECLGSMIVRNLDVLETAGPLSNAASYL